MNTTRAFAKPLIALLLTTFLLIAGMPNSAFGESTSMVYSTQSLTDSFLPTDDNMSTDLSLENDSFYLDIAVDEYPDPISNMRKPLSRGMTSQDPIFQLGPAAFPAGRARADAR